MVCTYCSNSSSYIAFRGYRLIDYPPRLNKGLWCPSLWQHHWYQKHQPRSSINHDVLYIYLYRYLIFKIITHDLFTDSLINFILFHIMFDCILNGTTYDCTNILYILWRVLVIRQMHKVRCMIRSCAITLRRVMPLTYSILMGWWWRVPLQYGVNKWVYYGMGVNT